MAKRTMPELLVPAAFALVALVGAVDFVVDDGWSRWLGAVMAVTGTIVAVGLYRKKGQPAKTPAPPTDAPKFPSTPDGPTIRTGGIRVSDLPPGLRRTDHPTRERKAPSDES